MIATGHVRSLSDLLSTYSVLYSLIHINKSSLRLPLKMFSRIKLIKICALMLKKNYNHVQKKLTKLVRWLLKESKVVWEKWPFLSIIYFWRTYILIFDNFEYFKFIAISLNMVNWFHGLTANKFCVCRTLDRIRNGEISLGTMLSNALKKSYYLFHSTLRNQIKPRTYLTINNYKKN